MPLPETTPTYYRKGFGLKAEVHDTLAADYTGRLVDLLRQREFELTAGSVTVRLAREFGFCYGVERAVEYAYQTRTKFPERPIFLAGEIIHNPHVNKKLREMGITFLRSDGGDFDYSVVGPGDVVILPAFGVTMRDFETLRAKNVVVVDTTCGSVLNVWKRVDSYARTGLTAVIHGKYYHEETRATASQVSRYSGGRYLVIRNMDEARIVCDYIEGRGSREDFVSRFAHSASPEFDPDRDLRRVGVANQTTMLARESLAIGEEIGRALARAHGEDYRAEHFRTFDTICSATQDRQDAVEALLREPLDVMLVIGGYNSSNTISLAAICGASVRTFHVEDAECLDVGRGVIRHRPIGASADIETPEWLGGIGHVTVGITAGASTPNNKIGEAVARVFATRGIDPGDIV
ncbi:MAG: 4-hydroxy-3-methylbut-2-enyl diphosphate reductase [Gemmatimonadales bacterium]|jgi:4-hydroxy-3-methylbut-2-enyl diphosphate reductase